MDSSDRGGSAMIPRYCARCKAVHGKTCPRGAEKYEALKKKPWRCNRQRGKHSGRGGRTWERRREVIFARDGYLCQMHLQRGELVTVQLHGEGHGVLDHIIPLSAGGSDDDDNLQTLCQECDKEKTVGELMERNEAKPRFAKRLFVVDESVVV